MSPLLHPPLAVVRVRGVLLPRFRGCCSLSQFAGKALTLSSSPLCRPAQGSSAHLNAPGEKTNARSSFATSMAPHKSRRTLWWVLGSLLAVVVILGAVLGGVLGSRASSDSDNSKSNAVNAADGAASSSSPSGSSNANGRSSGTATSSGALSFLPSLFATRT